jgi:hypothetical protein
MRVSIKLGWTLPVVLVLFLYKITGQSEGLSWWAVLSPMWAPWVLISTYILTKEFVSALKNIKEKHEKR